MVDIVENSNDNQPIINLSAQTSIEIHNTKQVGIIDDVTGFNDNDRIALYAVPFDKYSSTPDWTTAYRTISTTNASISNTGDIAIKHGSTAPVTYPDEILAFYSLYPVQASTGVIVTDNDQPKFDITLFDKCAEQFDVLVAKSENVGREAFNTTGTKKLPLTFNHALAQLQVNLYAEVGYPTIPKITKITVNATSNAQLNDIVNSTWSVTYDPFANHATPIDFTLYDNTAGTDVPVRQPEGTEKTQVGGTLMLFPGAQTSSITITVDGNEYTASVPADFNLIQGQLNIVDIQLTQLSADFIAATITPWALGEEAGTDIGVKNYTTDLNVKLNGLNTILSSPTNYDFAIKAQIAHKLGLDGKPLPANWLVENLDAPTHNIYLPATYNNSTGLISINDKVATLMLNSGAVYLTELVVAAKLKSASSTPFGGAHDIYTAKVSKLSPSLIISTTTGAVEVNDVGTMVPITLFPESNMMGDGTSAFPFEVTKDVNKAVFQDANYLSKSFIVAEKSIDFTVDNHSWVPIANTGVFKGVFDGNGATITVNINRNSMAGFFANVADATIKNLTIAGTIKNAGHHTGGIAAKMSSGYITRCTNNATITLSGPSGTKIGGLIGEVLKTGSSKVKLLNVFQSCNNGTISASTGSSSYAYIGGIIGLISTSLPVEISQSFNSADFHLADKGRVGGIVGAMSFKTNSVVDCYNVGTINGKSTRGKEVGGIAGYATAISRLANTYSAGRVVMTGSTLPLQGALIGKISASSAPLFVNLYYSDATMWGIGYVSSVQQTADFSMVTRTSNITASALNAGRDIWTQNVGLNNGRPVLKWQLEN